MTMNMIEEAITKMRQAGLAPPLPEHGPQSRDEKRRDDARAVAKARQSRRSMRSSNPDSELQSSTVTGPGPEITPEQVRAIVKEEARMRKKAAAKAARRDASAGATGKRADQHAAPAVQDTTPVVRERRSSSPPPSLGNSTSALDSLLPPTRINHTVEPATARVPTITRQVGQRKQEGRTAAKIDIDLKSLFAEGYLEAEGRAGLLSEEFRRIKRPLLANAFGQGLPAALNGERIMITSALPSEGKSFCAIHLALSIASEVENSVVLIEADVAKPTVLSKLGVEPRRGLANWFEDQTIDVTDLAVSTDLPGLKIVPAGLGAPDSIDMLASRAMARFFDLLREAYPNHLIIVDAPPLLPATEAKVLATHMGQVVVVVEAG